MTRQNKADVLIPHGYKPPKKDIEAAWILSKYYKTTVHILRPDNGYRIKTPDFLFNNTYFELKVLTSSQVRQLLFLLNRAKHQAKNIIIDIRKTKISEARASEVCIEFMRKHKQYKIFLITPSKNVLDIKAKHNI